MAEAAASSCAAFGNVLGYKCFEATCAGVCGLPVLQPAVGHPLPTAQQCTAGNRATACVHALATAGNRTANCEPFSAEHDGSVRLFAGAGVTANDGWTTVSMHLP